MKPRAVLYFLLCFVCILPASAQQLLQGVVTDEQGNPLPGATIEVSPVERFAVADGQGHFVLEVPYQEGLVLKVEFVGMEVLTVPLRPGHWQAPLQLRMKAKEEVLAEVEVTAAREQTFGVRSLYSVEGVAIYEGKKTEVVELQDIVANLATNNSRQIFGRIQGINIWESDMAGLQLGIGTRGLSPKRTANFNTRQNGYDMSADALGYPESYYVPPAEALERIELVKGAASLQYGTQFGGMLNFVMKSPRTDKPFHIDTRQTIGSWGFWNSYTGVDGTLGTKVEYFTFYQYKQGNGWRPNSQFHSHTAHTQWHFDLSKRLHLRAEYTHMQYLAKQPGGLMDATFEQDPSVSFRNRNWFAVRWNLPALMLDYRASDHTTLNLRAFANLSSRQALGVLLPAYKADDPTQNRTLIRDLYRNWGVEGRLLHDYKLKGRSHHFLAGVRYYHGLTYKQQGEADASDQPRFEYLNPHDLEKSDYQFPGRNVAVFAENIFFLNKRWSITPGIRYEYINTLADGYYKLRAYDAAGNLIAEERVDESFDLKRAFWLGGIGITFRPADNRELYANASQNYRAVTFSDLRIDNPNFRLDPNIRDERGYSTEIGFRGQLPGRFQWDVSLFYMRYNNRIGFVTLLDERIYNEYRFKTNVGDSQHYGLELYGEYNLASLWKQNTTWQWRLFSSFTYAEAYYLSANNDTWSRIEGNRVEFAPRIIWRAGLFAERGPWRLSLQHNYVSEQFSDADNTSGRVASAVVGIIPAYHVTDLSISYKRERWTVEGSVNNLLNQKYFTNRAVSYPGPGIIPADPRSFFLTLGISL
ncbi:MAG: TonB-dependent receptor [Thermonema sp.]|uniref:TonB-dependent receptor n=1 Tax=Thermonema sp. TaxID=2231181 RepID=UPI0021DC4592|nr:TonB-dependent receptor [Thermonema sp.]GIV38529.1 MAG: TonB-dependent receptor [Thermonema sp.]